MTTKITIDAHAGWPVDVTAIDSFEGSESRTTERVDPNAVRDFYATSSRKLLVEEVRRDADPVHGPRSSGDFGYALFWLRRGMKLARQGWNGKGMWLELQRPDEHSKMRLPYVFLKYPDDAKVMPGARVPWLASQTDMLADDWVIVPADGA